MSAVKSKQPVKVPTEAELLRMPGKLGQIVPGAHADLLVVDGDPFKDIACIAGQGEKLAAVMKAGRFAVDRLGA